MQTMILEQYYASGIHIEINDLLNSSFNPFSTNVPLLYPLKTSENLRFSDVFRGYRSATLVANEFKKASMKFATIIKIALIYHSHDIATIFMSSIAYSTKVNLKLIRNLNGFIV